MYEPNRNTDTGGERSSEISSWSFYNNGGNEGHIVQGQVSGNTFHAPRNPEEVAAKMRDYEAERAKFLRAEQKIKANIPSMITLSCICSIALATLTHVTGSSMVTISGAPFVAGTVGRVIVETVRLWNVRKKRENLSRHMRSLE
ncbi:hypothetical protein ACFU67_25440 [Streptomyces rhizosphaericola]|uniref:hypothetical protein n=1 Tax=Streptomyces rhizosphaericola TaxID=2564098 RepID=UPI0036C73693